VEEVCCPCISGGQPCETVGMGAPEKVPPPGCCIRRFLSDNTLSLTAAAGYSMFKVQ
jgi:hypothetical protein